MANKIAKIPVLEKLLKKRFHYVDGNKVEIGHFWSVLQIYLCMQRLQVSINTLCKAASLIEGRMDSKYRVDVSDISPNMMRKYLTLKSSPTQSSHTVVTKTVSRGASPELALVVKNILTKNNSYGPELLNEIMNSVDKHSGCVLGSKFSVMGNSGFSQVLKLSLLLIEMHKQGIIQDMSNVPNAEHLEVIIKTIQDKQKHVKNIDHIGFNLSAL